MTGKKHYYGMSKNLCGITASQCPKFYFVVFERVLSSLYTQTIGGCVFWRKIKKLMSTSVFMTC